MSKKRKRFSFRYIWETYLKPSLLDANCTRKHIGESELHLSRWEAFWRGDKSKGDKPTIPGCDRRHMEVYRRHLIAMDLYSPRTINKHLGSVRSILVAADKHGILKRRPKLEQLPDVTIDPTRKIYLRDEQIDALMNKTESLTWPPRSFSGICPKDWWRCAIVLYRTYGFRPQELLSYDSKKIPIRWNNISFAAESPNPSSQESNEHGWLHYVPPKTKKKKPHVLYLPLTKHARGALEKIAATRVTSDSALFPKIGRAHV